MAFKNSAIDKIGEKMDKKEPLNNPKKTPTPESTKGSIRNDLNDMGVRQK